MKKPTIYLDTNIVSVLHYEGMDINALSRRMATRDWWESERRHFELFASFVTEEELSEGVYDRQKECLRFVRRLKYVPVVAAARRLATAFVDANIIPSNKPGDAAQPALAAIHQSLDLELRPPGQPGHSGPRWNCCCKVWTTDAVAGVAGFHSPRQSRTNYSETQA